MAGGLIFGNAFPLSEGCTGTFPEFCPTAAGWPRRGPPMRQTGPGRQCAREVAPPVSEDMRTAPATLASATRSQCTPRSHRIAYTLEVLRAEVLKIEEIAFYAEKGLDRLIIIFCPLAVQDR